MAFSLNFESLREAILRHCKSFGVIPKEIMRTSTYRGKKCEILVILEKVVSECHAFPSDIKINETANSETFRVPITWDVVAEDERFHVISISRSDALLDILKMSNDVSETTQKCRWCFIVCDRIWDNSPCTIAVELRAFLLASSLSRLLSHKGFDARVLHPAVNSNDEFEADLRLYGIRSSSFHCDGESDLLGALCQQCSPIPNTGSNGLEANDQVCVLISRYQFESRLQRIISKASDSTSSQNRMTYTTSVCHPVHGFPTAKEVFEKRKVEVEAALKEKLGDKASDEGTFQLMNKLTIGSIKFDLLSKSASHEVKLSKIGIKVIYNYVRVKTLLRNYERLVHEGFYPHLAEVDKLKIEESELRTVEELWKLVWMFVDRFPSLMDEIQRTVVAGEGRTTAPIHKLCHFVMNMTQEFSCFYNRRHILIPNSNLTASQRRIMSIHLHCIYRIRSIYEQSFDILGIPLIEFM